MLYIYLCAINLVGLFVMWRDKRLAIRRKRRIPEKTLWLIAWIGGATCMTIGMFQFRHKTKHPSFRYGFPLLAVIQIAALLYMNLR